MIFLNDTLLLAYIGSIVVFGVSAGAVAVRGQVLFPRKQFLYLLAYFVSWALGIGILLASEWLAPYDTHFYLDPFWILAYIGLLGCAMLVAFFLAVDMHYRHVPKLPFVGGIAFVALLAGISLSAVTLSSSTATGYPWGFYLAAECAMGLGVVAFTLLARKSFQDSANTDRITGEQRMGLLTLGILALLMVVGLAIYALVLPFMDFSAPFNQTLTIGWLYWISGASIVIVVVIQRTYEMLAAH